MSQVVRVTSPLATWINWVEFHLLARKKNLPLHLDTDIKPKFIRKYCNNMITIITVYLTPPSSTDLRFTYSLQGVAIAISDEDLHYVIEIFVQFYSLLALTLTFQTMRDANQRSERQWKRLYYHTLLLYTQFYASAVKTVVPTENHVLYHHIKHGYFDTITPTTTTLYVSSI